MMLITSVKSDELLNLNTAITIILRENTNNLGTDMMHCA